MASNYWILSFDGLRWCVSGKPYPTIGEADERIARVRSYAAHWWGRPVSAFYWRVLVICAESREAATEAAKLLNPPVRVEALS